MTQQEKKDLIKKRLSEGDKRSYNEIAADLELYLWTEMHKGHAWTKQNQSAKSKTPTP